MKKILVQGKPKLFEATCPECGCVFSFIKKDIQEELVSTSTLSNNQSGLNKKKYVTCPCCGEEILSWD